MARTLGLWALYFGLGGGLLLGYATATTAFGFGLHVWRPCGGWSTVAKVAAVWVNVFAPLVAAAPPVWVLARGGSVERAARALLMSVGALVPVWLVFNQTDHTC